MNNKVALLCSKVCRLTYVKEYEFKNFQLTARFDNAGTDTQGIFGIAYDDTLVIGFRGTEETNMTDWITDLKFFQSDYPFADKSGVQVHSGFLESYSSVRDAVLQQVKSSDLKKVMCTGHSLGGPLANFAALDVSLNFSGKDVTCYTFGSPKPGNDNFAKLYKKQVPDTYRVVNGADKVPVLPPGSYEHVGKLQEVGQSGGGATSLKNQMVDSVKDSVMDHVPNAYIETLQKL